MTVTTASMQTNTKLITIKNETSYETIYSAINDAIVSLGWTLFDSLDNFIPGTGETSIYSPMFLRVYYAPNIDGDTYKYFILRLNYQKMMFWTSTCEYWDPKLHLPSNEAWNGSGSFMQHYDIIDSSIIINGTSRHLVIWPFIVGEPDLWTGVFEFERNALDLKSSCCFAWTNSVMIGTQYGITRSSASDGAINFSFPRTQDGVTGPAAATAYVAQAASSTYPPTYPSAFVTSTDANKAYLGSIHRTVNNWATKRPSSLDPMVLEKPILYPVSLRHKSSEKTFGKAYNLSVGYPFREPGTVTNLPLDSMGGWASESGSLSPTLSLPMNGGPETVTGTNASSSTMNAGQDKLSTPYVISNTYGNVYMIIMVGDYAYYTGEYGLFRWRLSPSIASLGTKNQPPEFLYREQTMKAASGTSRCGDLIHDGGLYIYFTINANIGVGATVTYPRIGRLNIFTLQVDTRDLPTMTGQAGRLTMDAQNIYIGSTVGSNPPPPIAIVPIADFLNGTILYVTQYLASGVLAVFPGFIGGWLFSSVTPTYSGSILGPTTHASSNGQNQSVYSIDVKKGYAVYASSTLTSNVAGNASNPRIIHADYCTGRMWLVEMGGYNGSSYANSTISEINSTVFLDGSLSGILASGTTNRYNYSAGTEYEGINCLGVYTQGEDPAITFIRGTMFIAKRGQPQHQRVVLSNPYTSGSTTLLGNNNVSIASASAGTAGEMLGANMMSVYTNGPRVAYTRATGTGGPGVVTAFVAFQNNIYGSSSSSGDSTARLFVKA